MFYDALKEVIDYSLLKGIKFVLNIKLKIIIDLISELLMKD